MALIKRLSRVGNSVGVTLDQAVLKQVGWKLGTEIEVSIEGDDIILTRHRYTAFKNLDASAKRMIEKHKKSFDELGQ